MFTGPDPFASVDDLMPQQLEGVENLRGKLPGIRRVVRTPTTQNHLAPQVAESSKAASKRNANASSSSLIAPLEKSKVTRPGDGWYVAYDAVSPGVYYGV